MTGKRVKLVVISVLGVAAIVLMAVFFPKLIGLAGSVVRLFMPFIIGYLFSLLVNPLAKALEKRFRLPRSVCAILVILLTVGVLGGILTAIIMKIVDEIKSIYENFPVIYVNMTYEWKEISDKFANIYAMLPSGVQEAVDNLTKNLFDSIAGLADIEYTPIFTSAGNFAKGLPGIFIAMIAFLLSSYFMISDSERVSGAINGIFSERFRHKIEAAKIEIKKYVGGYLKAQVIIMMFTFTILFIGLSILGVEYALIIALATAIFDALPFFGSGAVLWPWSIVSFLSGEIRVGVGLIIIYLCVIFTRQMIEPKIVSKKIGMNPIITLMSMYVGYKTLAIGGMIFGPLITMFCISLYRAGIFDGIIEFCRDITRIIKNEAVMIKNQFKE